MNIKINGLFSPGRRIPGPLQSLPYALMLSSAPDQSGSILNGVKGTFVCSASPRFQLCAPFVTHWRTVVCLCSMLNCTKHTCKLLANDWLPGSYSTSILKCLHFWTRITPSLYLYHKKVHFIVNTAHGDGDLLRGGYQNTQVAVEAPPTQLLAEASQSL